jgi:hypothetical protein
MHVFDRASERQTHAIPCMQRQRYTATRPSIPRSIALLFLLLPPPPPNAHASKSGLSFGSDRASSSSSRFNGSQ